MAEPLYSQLLGQAGHLARLDRGRPQQANLRRAVSAAYYALFHFLIDQATRSLVGGSPAHDQLRCVLARAFKHTEMADAARTFSGGSFPRALQGAVRGLRIPQELRSVATTLRVAQEERHVADYDLSHTFVRPSVLALIERVQKPIDDWEGIRKDPASRLFLVSLLVWDRIRRR